MYKLKKIFYTSVCCACTMLHCIFRKHRRVFPLRRISSFRKQLAAKLGKDKSRSSSHLEDRSRWKCRWRAATAGDNGNRQAWHVKNSSRWARASTKKLQAACHELLLDATRLRGVLMGLMVDDPPDEGASRRSRHRADSEKSAKPICWVVDSLWKGCTIDRSYNTRSTASNCRAFFFRCTRTCTFSYQIQVTEGANTIPLLFPSTAASVIYKTLWLIWNQFFQNGYMKVLIFFEFI